MKRVTKAMLLEENERLRQRVHELTYPSTPSEREKLVLTLIARVLRFDMASSHGECNGVSYTLQVIGDVATMSFMKRERK